LKWAKALLASAILCVSSRFFIDEPSFFEAAINSVASFSAIVFSARAEAYEINQRIARACRL
jgi:hypothetical protein